MATVVGALMELVRIVLTLTRPFSDRVLDLVYRLIFGPTPALPPVDDPILLMAATELAKKIRSRELKAADVMAAYIKRVQAVDPLINACTDQRFEAAMKDAVQADQYLDSTDKAEEEIAEEFPLLGVPFTCKESVGVKGMLMTNGLVRARHRRAPSDAESTAEYRRAGAIPVTTTNVPVFCMWWESANRCFGMTRNPYDHRRTVGGSSGGEGALITAAGAVIGIGTDIAGSIRIPGSFCGIYGHKPSRGVISVQEPWPQDDVECLDQFSSTGPMCRYAQDLRLATQVLAGETLTKLDWNKKVDFHKVKVYFMEELPGYLLKATPEIKAAIQKAARHFEVQFGVSAQRLTIEEFRLAFPIWECKLLEAGPPPFSEVLAEGGAPLSLAWEFLKGLVGCTDYTSPALYFAAVDRREKDKFYYMCLEAFESLKQKLEEALRGDAILLVPTHPEPPPHYLLTIPKYPNIAYTCIFNALGYPSSQVPAGLTSRGLPIGIQVVSRMFQDRLTIEAAVELDKVFGGWASPCRVAV